ncbi:MULTISPECIES: hypothetical protein [Pseudomonas syringae group genomosp. 2]|uniref:hypothetical protein n=1 Tax=Pseudomonas syringae group genomosp. 2 TaxID=251698 RepID=UPI00086C1013|nr:MULTISPECIES: hypothetical protein [Pseudomonas syringae group genomosp. 2]ODS47859.1 MAG: hypothetical protein BEH78_01210 [Pseudomonas sp. BDAL1]
MASALGIFSQALCSDCASAALQVGTLCIHINVAPAEGQRAACFTQRFVCRNQSLDTVFIQWTSVEPT